MQTLERNGRFNRSTINTLEEVCGIEENRLYDMIGASPAVSAELVERVIYKFMAVEVDLMNLVDELRHELAMLKQDLGHRRIAYNEYLHSDAWKQRRAAAIAIAGDCCQLCNSSYRLHVHHRTYERIYNEDPADLTVLCQACHETFHNTRTLQREEDGRETHT